MKTLSVRQPFAWLIMQGCKTLENRTWKTDHRGPLAIHASRTIDEAGMRHVVEQCASVGEPLSDVELAEMRVIGAVLGQVTLADCTRTPTGEDAQWHTPGQWGWILRDPIVIEPIPWTGHLGLFEIDLVIDVEQAE